MMIGSIREDDPVHMISMRKLNLCLFLVVLLEIEGLACQIGNVIVEILMKTVICVYFSVVVSLPVRFERPSAVLAVGLLCWFSV